MPAAPALATVRVRVRVRGKGKDGERGTECSSRQVCSRLVGEAKARNSTAKAKREALGSFKRGQPVICGGGGGNKQTVNKQRQTNQRRAKDGTKGRGSGAAPLSLPLPFSFRARCLRQEERVGAIANGLSELLLHLLLRLVRGELEVVLARHGRWQLISLLHRRLCRRFPHNR